MRSMRSKLLIAAPALIFLSSCGGTSSSSTGTNPPPAPDSSSQVDRPVFASAAAVSISENSTASGYTAQADAAQGALTYSISDGDDQALFEIDETSGEVSFLVAPDFEAAADADTNNIYNFTVTVTATSSDGSATETATQHVEITVTDDLSEVAQPVFTSDAASSTPENTLATGYRAQADVAQGALNYSISGGIDQARFEIDEASGVVRFRAAPDFEAPVDAGTNNTYALEVTATAADASASETATQDVAIIVTNIDEPTAGVPAIVNTSRARQRPREGDRLLADTSGITDGDGVGRFSYQWRRAGQPIPGATAATYRVAAADVHQRIRVAVTHTDAASNPSDEVLSAAVTIRGNVANNRDNVANNVAVPVFTSGTAFSTAENATATGYTAQANAAVGTVRYAISGGPDAALFEIDETSGEVTFNAAPHFENPADTDNNNIYNFTVTATATSADSSNTRTATQDVAITVTGDPGTVTVSIANTTRSGEDEETTELRLGKDLAVGDILSAVSAIMGGDYDMDSIRYQWRRDGTPINGATSRTYTVTALDTGAMLSVEFMIADNNGNITRVVSSLSTQAVALDADLPVALRDQGYRLVWHDEFDDDSLDDRKWSPMFQGKVRDFIHPNDNFGYFSSNVAVEDGELVITTREEEGSVNERTVPVKSGAVSSARKFMFDYGYLEAPNQVWGH